MIYKYIYVFFFFVRNILWGQIKRCGRARAMDSLARAQGNIIQIEISCLIFCIWQNWKKET